LENGEKNKAIQWFKFALSENPDSIESSIFLAETLYQQNRHEESSNYLQKVLGNNNTSAYNKATATTILSRISEQQGKFNDALIHAKKAPQTDVVGQCSADFVEQRIHRLESRVAM
jgi:tetratricopeptide (TPR) repeat protein